MVAGRICGEFQNADAGCAWPKLLSARWSQGFHLVYDAASAGVPSKMLYFPDEGLGNLSRRTRSSVQYMNDWVDQWCKKRARCSGHISLLITGSNTAALDFLRRLRIKNAVATMHYSLFGFLRITAAFGFVRLVVGCGGDLGTVLGLRIWGGFMVAIWHVPPRDAVSYWDGDNVNGSPSVNT